MALEDIYNLEELTNESERLVFRELERQLEEADEGVCRSRECVLDMAAYALNHVKPMYRANLMGRIYARAQQEERSEEIRRAVAEAIARISENPPE